MLKSKVLILCVMLSAMAMAQDTCTISELPVISFKKGNVFLTPKAKILLNSIIVSLKKSPGCKVHLTGHVSAVTYEAQQISWDQVTSITNYLQSKGVASNRWIFEYGAQGDPTIVDVVPVSMSEEGPSITPVPLPCFSFHKKGKRCVDKHGHLKN